MNAQKIEDECYSVSKEMLLLSREQNRLIRSDLAVLVKVMMNKREAETVPLINEHSILVKNSDLLGSDGKRQGVGGLVDNDVMSHTDSVTLILDV